MSMTMSDEHDPWYTAPPAYKPRRRVTRLGLKRKREVETVWLTGMREDANEALPILTEFPRLHQLWLISCHGLDLEFLPNLIHLEELALDESVATMPSPLVLPHALKRLMVTVKEPGELERLCRELDWSRVPDLNRLDLRVDHDQPPAHLDLGLIDQLPALRVLHLTGVWHDGPGPSPLIPPFARLPPDIANGALSFETAHPSTVRDALRVHYGHPIRARHTAEGRARRTDKERAAIEKEPRPDLPDDPRPYLSIKPLRDPAPTPPDPDWMLYRADDDAEWPWWTSGTLAPADDPDIPESPLGDKLAAKIKRADPQLYALIEMESDSEETFIYAKSPEDLEAALQIAGLTSPGIAK
jgi:hypothetical protein